MSNNPGTNAAEAYRTIVIAVEKAGFHLSPVLFTSTEVPEAVRDRSFRVMPRGPISYRSQGNSTDVQLVYDVAIAFAVPPEDELSVVQNAIMPALDLVTDELMRSPLHDPSYFFQAAVGLDETARYLVLSVTGAVNYFRNRVA